MKHKHWRVSALTEQRPVTVENDPFFTTDGQAYLVFQILDSGQDEDFHPETADVTLVNTSDRSVFHLEDLPMLGKTLSFEMESKYIRHSGSWQLQVIFYEGGVPKTIEPVSMSVQSHLLDNSVPREVDIKNWNSFVENAKDMIDEINDRGDGVVIDLEQLEEEYRQNEADRQARYDEQMEILEDKVENAIVEPAVEEKFNHLEEEYATDLTDLKRSDENLTSQLADKVDKNGSSQISENMLAQSLREKMIEGGNVAVVGNRSVGMGQLASDLQKDISSLERVFPEITMGVHYRDEDGVATQHTFDKYNTGVLNVDSGDVLVLDILVGSSQNQYGVLFVDDNFNITGKELRGSGVQTRYSDYEVVAPPKTTKAIFTVYLEPKERLSVSMYSYSGIAGKTEVEVISNRVLDFESGKVPSFQVQDLEILEGIHYRDEGGLAVEHSFARYHSAILPAQEGDEFELTTALGLSRHQIGAVFIDNEDMITGKFLDGVREIMDVEDFRMTAPENSVSIIVSVFDNKSTLKLKKRVLGDIATKDYVQEVSGDNFYEGKKIGFLGDSITSDSYNNRLSVRYPKYVVDELGAEEFNYGISSSVIAVKETAPNGQTPMVTRYTEMDDDLDLIVVAGGTNDWYYTRTPIGNMEDRTNFTFYGALHNLCLGLKKKYKNKPILFMSPIMRRQANHNSPSSTNGNGKTLKEYGDIIKEVCDYYSILFLDMYSESGLYPFDDELAIEYYNQQGSEGNYYYTHPNSNGHLMMGRRLLGYLNQLA